MKLIKCDVCLESVGDFQLEVLQVGDRKYDLHAECAKKLKGMLKGEGEPVPSTWIFPLAPTLPPNTTPNPNPWDNPQYPQPWIRD